ncbi:hypothetical protein CEUSTIGMA_g10241.t1 [Chlamydomonas eustigma]|uniref:Uncharacterized protein n=1 Tax=Chlamydomonas eustigma TaxID=1157962 RepID=A0A250XI98_9CHLO|nr:hypothetical protein CEUSTIGMA_g10241.t1 [Chlamydomonas eustigma]|eukprot:GAX82815.1 hypothetical protein CEUSTIGMA_g10241.t1 [Chlamydomonas eustigma]
MPNKDVTCAILHLLNVNFLKRDSALSHFFPVTRWHHQRSLRTQDAHDNDLHGNSHLSAPVCSFPGAPSSTMHCQAEASYDLTCSHHSTSWIPTHKQGLSGPNSASPLIHKAISNPQCPTCHDKSTEQIERDQIMSRSGVVHHRLQVLVCSTPQMCNVHYGGGTAGDSAFKQYLLSLPFSRLGACRQMCEQAHQPVLHEERADRSSLPSSQLKQLDNNCPPNPSMKDQTPPQITMGSPRLSDVPIDMLVRHSILWLKTHSKSAGDTTSTIPDGTKVQIMGGKQTSEPPLFVQGESSTVLQLPRIEQPVLQCLKQLVARYRMDSSLCRKLKSGREDQQQQQVRHSLSMDSDCEALEAAFDELLASRNIVVQDSTAGSSSKLVPGAVVSRCWDYELQRQASQLLVWVLEQVSLPIVPVVEDQMQLPLQSPLAPGLDQNPLAPELDPARNPVLVGLQSQYRQDAYRHTESTSTNKVSAVGVRQPLAQQLPTSTSSSAQLSPQQHPPDCWQADRLFHIHPKAEADVVHEIISNSKQSVELSTSCDDDEGGVISLPYSATVARTGGDFHTCGRRDEQYSAFTLMLALRVGFSQPYPKFFGPSREHLVSVAEVLSHPRALDPESVHKLLGEIPLRAAAAAAAAASTYKACQLPPAASASTPVPATTCSVISHAAASSSRDSVVTAAGSRVMTGCRDDMHSASPWIPPVLGIIMKYLVTASQMKFKSRWAAASSQLRLENIIIKRRTLRRLSSTNVYLRQDHLPPQLAMATVLQLAREVRLGAEEKLSKSSRRKETWSTAAFVGSSGADAVLPTASGFSSPAVAPSSTSKEEAAKLVEAITFSLRLPAMQAEHWKQNQQPSSSAAAGASASASATAPPSSMNTVITTSITSLASNSASWSVRKPAFFPARRGRWQMSKKMLLQYMIVFADLAWASAASGVADRSLVTYDLYNAAMELLHMKRMMSRHQLAGSQPQAAPRCKDWGIFDCAVSASSGTGLPGRTNEVDDEVDEAEGRLLSGLFAASLKGCLPSLPDCLKPRSVLRGLLHKFFQEHSAAPKDDFSEYEGKESLLQQQQQGAEYSSSRGKRTIVGKRQQAQVEANDVSDKSDKIRRRNPLLSLDSAAVSALSVLKELGVDHVEVLRLQGRDQMVFEMEKVVRSARNQWEGILYQYRLAQARLMQKVVEGRERMRATGLHSRKIGSLRSAKMTAEEVQRRQQVSSNHSILLLEEALLGVERKLGEESSTLTQHVAGLRSAVVDPSLLLPHKRSMTRVWSEDSVVIMSQSPVTEATTVADRAAGRLSALPTGALMQQREKLWRASSATRLTAAGEEGSSSRGGREQGLEGTTVAPPQQGEGSWQSRRSQSASNVRGDRSRLLSVDDVSYWINPTWQLNRRSLNQDDALEGQGIKGHNRQPLHQHDAALGGKGTKGEEDEANVYDSLLRDLPAMELNDLLRVANIMTRLYRLKALGKTKVKGAKQGGEGGYEAVEIDRRGQTLGLPPRDTNSLKFNPDDLHHQHGRIPDDLSGIEASRFDDLEGMILRDLSSVIKHDSAIKRDSAHRLWKPLACVLMPLLDAVTPVDLLGLLKLFSHPEALQHDVCKAVLLAVHHRIVDYVGMPSWSFGGAPASSSPGEDVIRNIPAFATNSSSGPLAFSSNPTSRNRQRKFQLSAARAPDAEAGSSTHPHSSGRHPGTVTEDVLPASWTAAAKTSLWSDCTYSPYSAPQLSDIAVTVASVMDVLEGQLRESTWKRTELHRKQGGGLAWERGKLAQECEQVEKLLQALQVTPLLMASWVSTLVGSTLASTSTSSLRGVGNHGKRKGMQGGRSMVPALDQLQEQVRHWLKDDNMDAGDETEGTSHIANVLVLSSSRELAIQVAIDQLHQFDAARLGRLLLSLSLGTTTSSSSSRGNVPLSHRNIYQAPSTDEQAVHPSGTAASSCSSAADDAFRMLLTKACDSLRLESQGYRTVKKDRKEATSFVKEYPIWMLEQRKLPWQPTLLPVAPSVLLDVLSACALAGYKERPDWVAAAAMQLTGRWRELTSQLAKVLAVQRDAASVDVQGPLMEEPGSSSTSGAAAPQSFPSNHVLCNSSPSAAASSQDLYHDGSAAALQKQVACSRSGSMTKVLKVLGGWLDYQTADEEVNNMVKHTEVLVESGVNSQAVISRQVANGGRQGSYGGDQEAPAAQLGPHGTDLDDMEAGDVEPVAARQVPRPLSRVEPVAARQVPRPLSRVEPVAARQVPRPLSRVEPVAARQVPRPLSRVEPVAARQVPRPPSSRSCSTPSAASHLLSPITNELLHDYATAARSWPAWLDGGPSCFPSSSSLSEWRDVPSPRRPLVANKHAAATTTTIPRTLFTSTDAVLYNDSGAVWELEIQNLREGVWAMSQLLSDPTPQQGVVLDLMLQAAELLLLQMMRVGLVTSPFAISQAVLIMELCMVINNKQRLYINHHDEPSLLLLHRLPCPPVDEDACENSVDNMQQQATQHTPPTCVDQKRKPSSPLCGTQFLTLLGNQLCKEFDSIGRRSRQK